MFEHAQGVASITLATVQQARPNVPAPPARQLQVKYCTVLRTRVGQYLPRSARVADAYSSTVPTEEPTK
jgi:hypothetical protein